MKLSKNRDKCQKMSIINIIKRGEDKLSTKKKMIIVCMIIVIIVVAIGVCINVKRNTKRAGNSLKLKMIGKRLLFSFVFM